MKRRTLLTSLAVGSVALSGCSVLGDSADDAQAGYLGNDNIVYEHESLNLQLRQQAVHPGETVEFEITNTGEDDMGLGCKNPWAIQRYSDGNWEHLTWTGGRFYNQCLTLLSPDSSFVESITLTKPDLEEYATELDGTLTPGTYRYILVGTSPYLALDFEILEGQGG
jgi:hypothetical protein